MITQKILKEYFDYHEGGYLVWKKLNKFTVNTSIGNRFGSINKRGYRKGCFLGKYLLEHRMIFLFHHGYIPKIIDHINGNKSDNKINNLRSASSSQNSQNRKTSNNKSGYKGVYYNAGCKKPYSTIAVNKKRINLGVFDTPEEAHEAYRKASKEFHKEFSGFGKV